MTEFNKKDKFEKGRLGIEAFVPRLSFSIVPKRAFDLCF